MQDFKNILPGNKNTLNYFLWAIRPINLAKTYNQNRPKPSPDELKAAIYNNENLHRRLKKICEVNKEPYSKQIVLDLLSEIGYAYDLIVFRLMEFILARIVSNTFSALHVNEYKLFTIKNGMGDAPILFMPSHRSYCDFLLMTHVCFNYGINIPCIAAGIDLNSMWFMNDILRKCKAFYMRRTFHDDIVYKTVFQEYVKALISYEDSPIEFFIEGTRSRSGKSLMPKFGLLTVLIEAFLCGDIPDIKVIPVNISYDRVLEETLFAYEHLGAPKPKETTIGLIKALADLNGGYGASFVNFGDPFSIRTYLSSEDNIKLKDKEFLFYKVKDISFKIIEAQQKLQVYRPINILALIIYNNLKSLKTNIISFEDAVVNFKWLLKIYYQFGAKVVLEGAVEDALKYAIDLHSSLFELTDEGFIIFKKCSNSSLYKDNIYLEGLPFVKLQLYINPSLNLFIRSSMIAAILVKNGVDNKLTEDMLYSEYMFLCCLLNWEFVLNENENEQYKKSISRLKELGLIPCNNGLAHIQLKSNSVIFLCNLIEPFFVGVYLICSFLCGNDFPNRTSSELAEMAQSYIAGKINHGINSYCLSLNLIHNTFKSLAALNVIQNEKKKVIILKKEFLIKAINFLGKFLTKDDILQNVKLNKKITSKL